MKDSRILVIMNFSGVYEAEGFYKDYGHVWVDCKEIEGTNCYCDEEGENAIREAIRELGPEGIHFLDSGNYHYVSKIWMEKIEEEFELLVLDHHTDMQPPMFGDILSCGSWIKDALDSNPAIRHVWLAGPPADAADEIRAGEYGGRVTCVPEELTGDGDGWRERLGDSGLPLYISVDKDMLGPDHARTNWDQGSGDLQAVLACMDAAASCRRVIGVDVCGENPEGMEREEDGAGDCSINDRTNGVLVHRLFNLPFYGKL